MSPAVALVTVVAVATTPGVPWYVGPAALVLAALAALDRHWLWSALGVTLLWVPALGGPAGAGVLAGAILLGALRWRTLSTGIVVVALVLAAKQGVAAAVLPGATFGVAWLLVALVTTAGAVSAARGGRVEAAALAVGGGIVLARLGLVWAVDGEARVAAAARLDAVDMVYDRLAADATEPVALALLRVAPDRDPAALRVGWARALDLGWRPERADGVVAPVARALEARGRGGEALRLLARHPREGEIDALRALLERTQGVTVRWRGAPLGPNLPGRFEPALQFETNGWSAIEFTASRALPWVVVEGVGAAYAGAPVLEVRLDGAAPVEWALDGPSELTLDGPLAPGPHRIGVRFLNDRVDAEGDRNVRVVGVRAE